MKVKSKSRLLSMEKHEAVGAGLVVAFEQSICVPEGWKFRFQPGRPISDYNGGGHRYEYDSVALMSEDSHRKDIAFPCLLDACSRYQESVVDNWPNVKGARVSWAKVLNSACWQLREWLLEIGITESEESDLSSLLFED